MSDRRLGFAEVRKGFPRAGEFVTVQSPTRSTFVVGVICRVSLPFMGTPPTIELGNLGMADSLILMVLALVVFGPRRLPQIGRQIGKLMYEFRKASNDFKFQMEEELRLAEDAERRKKEEEQRKRLAATQAPQESVSATPEMVKTMQSPQPREDTYPEIKDSPPQTEETAEPRILPPSTGETVASNRRSELAELTEPPDDGKHAPKSDDATPAAPDRATPGLPRAEAQKDESSSAMEAASRNG
jgi:sec-independent protein translocase protein TatB